MRSACRVGYEALTARRFRQKRQVSPASARDYNCRRLPPGCRVICHEERDCLPVHPADCSAKFWLRWLVIHILCFDGRQITQFLPPPRRATAVALAKQRHRRIRINEPSWPVIPVIRAFFMIFTSTKCGEPPMAGTGYWATA